MKHLAGVSANDMLFGTDPDRPITADAVAAVVFEQHGNRVVAYTRYWPELHRPCIQGLPPHRRPVVFELAASCFRQVHDLTTTDPSDVSED